MLTLDEAKARVLSGVHRLSSERVALAEGLDRVLAEPVVARSALPPFDHSAMDGYAVATRDLEGPSPWELPVCGESSAGSVAPALAASSASRIFTGAPLPAGADAVVAQENVERDRNTVRLHSRPKVGEHVRKTGHDLPAGALALAAGARLNPGALALAAMLDEAELVVARRPRVTILCTGNELRAVGGRAHAGSIPESNAVALAALARQGGAASVITPIVRDDVEQATEAIQQALDSSDLLLTVGGVSVGDHDVVRPALERAGVTLDFWKVAIKPGKPIAFGRYGRGSRVLGLPGNPASALVTFALFGVPLLRAMQGDERPSPMPLCAHLAAARKRSVDRIELLRAELRRENAVLVVFPHDNQASGAATSLAKSDGVAVIAPGEGLIEAGAPVDFIRWADV
ncbi:MAG TPA: gephyrin-like molybdotransferase Glp [Polyangiaceae bacterium]|nr:gephyrin-like molybdotransferase Glp [Polyangiaceae bacterium]